MKLSNIQVLRAIAAAMVVYIHALITFDAKVGPIGSSGFVAEDVGDLGVKLFFVISGFIIFNSSIRLPSGLGSAIYFMVKRCIRILPLYWLATTIYGVKLALQGEAPGVREYMSSIFFVPYSNSAGIMRPILGQGWTLNFEMLFYVLTALLLLLRSRFRYQALIASLLLAVATNHIWLSGSALSFVTTELLLFFVAGILVGMYPLRASPFGRVPALLVAVVALGFAGVVPMLLTTPESVGKVVIEWLCCGAAVLVASAPVRNQSALRPVVLAGDGSYSTYLLHGFLMGPIARLLALTHLQVPLHVFAALMVVLCTAVGIFCYLYFERPVQHWLGATLKPPATTSLVAP